LEIITLKQELLKDKQRAALSNKSAISVFPSKASSRIASPAKNRTKKRDVQVQLPVTLLSNTIKSQTELKQFEVKNHYPLTGPATNHDGESFVSP
jgi:hypothetical protein